MDFINNIKEETLIICNQYEKENILKINKLLPIKIMNIEEFKEKYFFSYDESAILYLIKKYNIKYEIAKEYINNLYYIDNNKSHNEKLIFLTGIKKELDTNNLLKYNKEFKNYLKRVKIIIYHQKLNNFFKNIFKNYHYEEIKKEYKNYTHKVYEFDTMEEEIHYIANEIASLIDKGISTQKIKLMNVDESYFNTIERIFNLYNLKPGINYKRILSSYPIVKEFINIYKQKEETIESSLSKLDSNNPIYNEIINIINKYLKYDSKELIIYKLEHSYLTSNKFDNEISLVDYLEYPIKDDEYYFMISFNETIIPKNYMDTEYLTDNIKELLNLETTKELNKELRIETINIINSIKNLTITYKLKDFKSNYYPSSLISNFEVEKQLVDYKISYSETYNKMSLVKEYDNYIKYGYKSNNFDLLNNNYQISYNSFNNKYHKIDRTMDKLNLSYSKMQIYNKCAFRYYLTDILKLDIFEENFSTVIGSMVHFVMEKCLSNEDYDVNKYASIYLKDKELTKKEQFFLEKYKKEVSELLNQVLLEKEYTTLKDALYEKKIDIDYGNNIHFIGIIDKVLYNTDGLNTYIALVDYKTGNDDISLKYLKYGLNIQLPIYLYLSKELPFKNPLYTGFYLQKFNLTDKDYRLVGYSNSNPDILSKFDNNYESSKIIKGLKTLKDGSFSKNSKVLTNEEINNIKDITKNIINDTINKIKNNCFEINPKIDNEKNISCEFCKYSDICFKQKEDEIKLEVTEFRGDE